MKNSFFFNLCALCLVALLALPAHAIVLRSEQKSLAAEKPYDIAAKSSLGSALIAVIIAAVTTPGAVEGGSASLAAAVGTGALLVSGLLVVAFLVLDEESGAPQLAPLTPDQLKELGLNEEERLLVLENTPVVNGIYNQVTQESLAANWSSLETAKRASDLAKSELSDDAQSAFSKLFVSAAQRAQ